ncbi:unnamed protein product [Adineta steineri]|uniref:Uncharacterized protein n=1 Tax=Adineta steineri TaxID=433720 RepID=A0A814CCR0_9BILA|nr:unnamed protein product [Adineta steineri]
MHLPNILKSKGRRTTKAAALIATQLNILYHGCIVIIVMSVLSSLSIAALVIGFIKQGECPIQAWIPRWLIIFGSVGLGWCALFILMGSVWVFTVRTRVQFEYPSDANYCQKLVYNMAFGCILTQYGIIGLALCLTACCFALVKICDRD